MTLYPNDRQFQTGEIKVGGQPPYGLRRKEAKQSASLGNIMLPILGHHSNSGKKRPQSKHNQRLVFPIAWLMRENAVYGTAQSKILRHCVFPLIFSTDSSKSLKAGTILLAQ
jgi:hypothetical protein